MLDDAWSAVQFYLLEQKNMPQAFDVTVLIDIFKRPQDETQTCMVTFFFKLIRRMFLICPPGNNGYPFPRNVWVQALRWFLYPRGAL